MADMGDGWTSDTDLVSVSARIKPQAASLSNSPQSASNPASPDIFQLGATPTIGVDDPICAVLMLVFTVLGTAFACLLHLDIRRRQRVLFTPILIVFCLARVAALVLRMARAEHPTDYGTTAAALVIMYGGILLLYLVNLVFTRRFLHAYARFGQHVAVDAAFWFLVFGTVASLIMGIVATVATLLTVYAHRMAADVDADYNVQLFSLTFIVAVACMPIPLALLVGLFPRKRRHGPQQNGEETLVQLARRLRLLMFTSVLLGLEAGFRCATAFDDEPDRSSGWIQGKAAYYCFNYVTEILVLAGFLYARFDKGYRSPQRPSRETEDERHRLNSEDQVFGPAAKSCWRSSV